MSEVTCYNCHGKGHIAVRCPTRESDGGRGGGGQSKLKLFNFLAIFLTDWYCNAISNRPLDNKWHAQVLTTF